MNKHEEVKRIKKPEAEIRQNHFLISLWFSVSFPVLAADSASKPKNWKKNAYDVVPTEFISIMFDFFEPRPGQD